MPLFPVALGVVLYTVAVKAAVQIDKIHAASARLDCQAFMNRQGLDLPGYGLHGRSCGGYDALCDSGNIFFSSIMHVGIIGS